MSRKTLLVENNSSWIEILRPVLEEVVGDAGRVEVCQTFDQGWERLTQQGPWDLLVTDIGLGGTRNLGEQLADEAKLRGVTCLVVSGTLTVGRQQVRNLLMKQEVLDFFDKDNFSRAEFKRAVMEVLGEVWVFVSYCREDPTAPGVLTGLRERGVPLWDYQESQRPGESLHAGLERAIQQAPLCLILRGPAKSAWSDGEIEIVMSRQMNEGTDILPVLLPGAERSSGNSFLDRLNPVDLRAGVSAESLDRLSEEIRRRLSD